MITVDPHDPRPIWRQIEEALRDLVLVGRLEPAAPVPSVRELARAAQVNPATVAKAYRALSTAGYFEVKRGEGTFVARRAPGISRSQRQARLRNDAQRLVDLASRLGMDPTELNLLLAELWKEVDDESIEGRND